jgi:very-short-patch-repair endonuclease
VDDAKQILPPNRQDLRVESVPEALARLRGRATFAELVAATSRRQLASAVSSGAVERLARGYYVLPAPTSDHRVAVSYDGVVSHVSAAMAGDLPLLLPPEHPHVTVPTKRRPRTGPPAVLHWAPIDPDDLPSRLTSMVRTVVDCARILPFGEALAVADAALASGLMRRVELETATTAMRGPGRPNARKVAAAATGASASFLESMLRALLSEAGIEGFEPQLLITSGTFRARVDLGHRAARIVLEAEGYAFHGSSSDFSADCRRYDELVAAGWLVLRFTYHQVVSDSAWVVATVRRVLATRASEPSDRK